MPYAAEISRTNPTCIVLVLDQSASMADRFSGATGEGVTKAGLLADVLNRSLMELVTACRKPEGILDYFYVGVLSYAGNEVRPALGGALAGVHISPVSALGRSPMRVETRRKQVPDGAGGLVETEVRFPVWFDPAASGNTPMCQGLETAAEMVAEWCEKYPRSFPPTVLHVTDGEATDGDEAAVEAAAGRITARGTDDGTVLLLNLHVSGEGGTPIRFPTEEKALPDSYARMLFRMSSVLPEEFRRRGEEAQMQLAPGCRGYVYNAGIEDVVRFFRIGTRPRLAAADR
ncbi:VWA domain-containing protein [Rhodovastum atsumiense]|uniref:VWA domain-containing protein n=1 Tax=Rhodovastum atsumiense TaxID=504468 RepID=A0A5M6IYG8_9PROT|nr:vWA domain-containing protein [Rhodovastum atsumiense]KAA5613383.1 VWA domain-containing protein [Rhodovastum atsumiense]CAH2603068.1 VWA domain-containing protein [Rhodovastum atsumiense]